MNLSDLRPGDVLIGFMTQSIYLVARKDSDAEVWFNLTTGEVHDVKDEDENVHIPIRTFTVVRGGRVILEPE